MKNTNFPGLGKSKLMRGSWWQRCQRWLRGIPVISFKTTPQEHVDFITQPRKRFADMKVVFLDDLVDEVEPAIRNAGQDLLIHTGTREEDKSKVPGLRYELHYPRCITTPEERDAYYTAVLTASKGCGLEGPALFEWLEYARVCGYHRGMMEQKYNEILSRKD